MERTIERIEEIRARAADLRDRLTANGGRMTGPVEVVLNELANIATFANERADALEHAVLAMADRIRALEDRQRS